MTLGLGSFTWGIASNATQGWDKAERSNKLKTACNNFFTNHVKINDHRFNLRCFEGLLEDSEALLNLFDKNRDILCNNHYLDPILQMLERQTIANLKAVDSNDITLTGLNLLTILYNNEISRKTARDAITQLKNDRIFIIIPDPTEAHPKIRLDRK